MSENISSSDLDSFENPNVESDYLIKIKIPEFTCLCPVTVCKIFLLSKMVSRPLKVAVMDPR